ncbi:MAG TPA: hypothetical protein VIL20_19375 [Sandaracinaceae bacterium]
MALGCVGDPDVGAADPVAGSVEAGEVTIERSVWEAAPAGCEGALERGLTIASCEGEPSLAALIDERGEPRCVDARSLILREAGALTGPSPVAGDPSPQPNRPAALGGAASGSGPR